MEMLSIHVSPQQTLTAMCPGVHAAPLHRLGVTTIDLGFTVLSISSPGPLLGLERSKASLIQLVTGGVMLRERSHRFCLEFALLIPPRGKFFFIIGSANTILMAYVADYLMFCLQVVPFLAPFLHAGPVLDDCEKGPVYPSAGFDADSIRNPSQISCCSLKALFPEQVRPLL